MHTPAPAGTVVGVYGILDVVAMQLVGGLQVHRHEATAIRTFGDIANQQGSIVQLHPADFNLVRLGYLNDDQELVPDKSTVLTGMQLFAAQNPNGES